MNTEFQNLPNVVSPKEVQTYFGISRSTTYRIFHDATFPAFHIGNRLLVRRDELLGWLEQQKVNKAQNENLNSTPFVRQYDILSNRWGDLLCQEENRTNDIRRNSREWL